MYYTESIPPVLGLLAIVLAILWLIALLSVIGMSGKLTNVVKLLRANLEAQNLVVEQLHELRQELQDQRTDANPL